MHIKHCIIAKINQNSQVIGKDGLPWLGFLQCLWRHFKQGNPEQVCIFSGGGFLYICQEYFNNKKYLFKKNCQTISFCFWKGLEMGNIKSTSITSVHNYGIWVCSYVLYLFSCLLNTVTGELTVHVIFHCQNNSDLREWPFNYGSGGQENLVGKLKKNQPLPPWGHNLVIDKISLYMFASEASPLITRI